MGRVKRSEMMSSYSSPSSRQVLYQSRSVPEVQDLLAKCSVALSICGLVSKSGILLNNLGHTERTINRNCNYCLYVHEKSVIIRRVFRIACLSWLNQMKDQIRRRFFSTSYTAPIIYKSIRAC